MFRRICNAIAAALALASISGAASAGSTTTTLEVSATVVAACTASTVPLNFGSFATLATGANATSTLTVNCASGTPWTATADLGLSGGASFTRNLTGPAGAILSYLLATTNANRDFGLPWGNGTGVSTAFTGMGTGVNQVNTIFGKIFARLTIPAAGAYSDTVTVTVSF